MAPPKVRKGGKGPKKEKVFHPNSRKAAQLNRVQVRKQKLDGLTRARRHRSREQGT